MQLRISTASMHSCNTKSRADEQHTARIGWQPMFTIPKEYIVLLRDNPWAACIHACVCVLRLRRRRRRHRPT